MEQGEIAEKIRDRFPDDVLGVVAHGGQLGVVLKADNSAAILAWLQQDPDMQMDHLRGLCGVDNSKRETGFDGRFEVVYQLYSISLRHGIRLRVPLPADNPRVATVTPLWAGADWLEREVFDMFGILFDGHPNLSRVLMPDDWELFLSLLHHLFFRLVHRLVGRTIDGGLGFVLHFTLDVSLGIFENVTKLRLGGYTDCKYQHHGY